MTWVLAFAIAAAVAAAGSWAIASGRVRLGARSSGPRPDRWHERPTPAFGGVAMFAGFAAALLIVDGAGDASVEALAAVGVVFALGLADDLRGFRPLPKLAGQLAGAALFVGLDVAARIPGPAVLAIPATVAFLVVASNAVNLLDNMDTVAGGALFATTATLALWGIADGAVVAAAMLAALAGALAGFLAFNVHPARLFMGDSGSLWLGMLVAALALAEAGAAPSDPRRLLIPVALLAVPLLDTAVVVVARAVAGRPIMQGGTDHTAHRLVRLGLGQRSVAALLFLLAAGGGAAASIVRFAHSAAWVLAPIVLVGVAGWLALVVLRAEPAPSEGFPS